MFTPSKPLDTSEALMVMAGDEIERLKQENNDLKGRVTYLRGILRRLVDVPAIRQAVGTNHVGSCNCPMCFAQQELLHD